MKKLMVVVAALVCAFAAVADGNSDKQDGDSPLWMPLGVLNFSSSGGAIVFPILNLGF